jgi:hypothetical protein
MGWNYEKLASIAGGINSAVVAVAVIVGGLWTWFVFGAELRVENARAELEKLNRELAVRPALDISLATESLSIGSGTQKVVLVTVTISNKGTKDAIVLLGQAPIRAAQVVISSDGQVFFGKTYQGRMYGSTLSNFDRIEAFDEAYTRVGDTERLQAVVRVDGPGLYLFEFVAPMQDSYEAPAFADKVSNAWTAQLYSNLN